VPGRDSVRRAFDPFGVLSKLVLAAEMYLGRLEIVPVLVLFARRYWRSLALAQRVDGYACTPRRPSEGWTSTHPLPAKPSWKLSPDPRPTSVLA